MGSMLTAKEVEKLLNVDRTTIYRMLKDGRLRGVKVGQQWRFSAEHVEGIVSGQPVEDEPSEKELFDALPTHCMQPIQDVFAEIANVGSIITDESGNPLTRVSNSCDFCKLILGSTEGREQCLLSWKKMIETDQEKPTFAQCHAGLQYVTAPIEVGGEFVASLFAGQFYLDRPMPDEEQKRIHEFAVKYKISPALLSQAAKDIPFLRLHRKHELEQWLQRIADTFGEISKERASLLGRLKQLSGAVDGT